MPAETADQTAWVLDRARRLAADVLGPAAMTVEATQRVPREHLDLLGPPRLRARAVPGGSRLDGTSPWVTGWGHVDLLYTAARDEQDDIVWAMVDAQAGGTLSAEPVPMVAVMASATVELGFDGHFVPAGRVTGTMSQRDWQQRDRTALRPDGSLALGLAARCCAQRLAREVLFPLVFASRPAIKQSLNGLLTASPARRASQ
jgi:alkylation response protein AidB-like acyl-CoA dehydrogenase